MEDLFKLFSIFSELELLIPEEVRLRKKLSEYVGKTSTLVVTDECNLRCSYCYCTKSPKVMTWDTAKDFIDYHFEVGKDFHLVPRQSQEELKHRKIWDFVGGEPLLQADLVFKCMDYIVKKTKVLHDNHPWKRTDWPCGDGKNCNMSEHLGYRFMLDTNGILLNDPAIQRQLLRYKNTGQICIGVTLDGDQHMHDLCRVDTKGKGSFEQVIRAWYWLRSNFSESTLTTKSTIAHENIDCIARLVDFFYSLEPLFYLSQNCVFENVWHRGDQCTLFDQLCEVADFLIKDKKYTNFMVRWFDVGIFKPRVLDGNKWCGAGTSMDACDYSGKIYPCLRFKQTHVQPPIVIGNIKTGIDADSVLALATGDPIENSDAQLEVTGLDCKPCPIASLCADCQAHTYDSFGRCDIKSPFICPMHKAVSVANIYFFGKIIHMTSLDDISFRDSLRELLVEYTKNDYFGYDEFGNFVPWVKHGG